MADVIREFLVSLGYSVDKKSETDFKRSTREAVVQAKLVADAIEGAARTLMQGFAQMAQGFSALEYQAERTKNSVQGLRNVAYAFQQIGLTAEDASSVLEGFASKLRENPSMKNYLERLGVDTKGKQQFEDVIGLVDRLKKTYGSKGDFGYTNASAIASQFGIQEKVFYQLWNNLDEAKRRIAKRQSIADLLGFDSDKAAKDWREFLRSMTDTAAIFQDIFQKAFSDNAPTIQKKLEEFNAWLMAHGKEIGDDITKIGTAVAAAAEDFGTLAAQLAPVIEKFDAMIKELTGDDGLKAAFEVFAVYLTTSWLARILGVFSRVGFGWMALAALVGFAPNSMEQAKANGDAINDSIGGTGIGSWFVGTRNKVRGWFGLKPLDARGNVIGGSSTSSAANVSGDSEQAIADAKGSPSKFVNAFYRAGIEAGLTDTQARLMAAQAGLESGYGRHAPGNNFFGIKAGRSWGGDTQSLSTTEVGPNGPYSTVASFRKYPSLAAGIQDRIAFMKSHFPDAWNANDLDEAISALNNGKYGSYATEPNYGYLVRGVSGKITANAEQVRQEMALKSAASRAARAFDTSHPAFDWAKNVNANLGAINSGAPLGGGLTNSSQVTIAPSSTTHIVVNGATDPAATANAIESKQNGVNSMLLRNAQGAVR